MSVEKIKEYYARQGYDQHIHMFMALQCGPLLKGMVHTSVVSLDNRMEQAFRRTLRATKFRYALLYRGIKRSVVFIYEEKHLRSHLMQQEVADCLKAYGYCNNESKQLATDDCAIDLQQICRMLTYRMTSYYNGETEFPHEIGFFLEYPPEDVKAFIRNKGQNYLLSGYWKVYENAEEARVLFDRFDKAREEAVEEVLNGKKFYEIVA